MEKITAEMSRVGIDQVESGRSAGEVKRISRESKKHMENTQPKIAMSTSSFALLMIFKELSIFPLNCQHLQLSF